MISSLLWWLTVAGLAAGLVAAVAWYLRQVSLRRLPAPGFFLIALSVHLLLGIGSFYVYLDNGVCSLRALGQAS